MVTADVGKAYVYHDHTTNSALEDAGIVATHMMLAAENLGLNTCWLNAFDPANVKNALGIPGNETPVMMLDIGYKALISPAAPMHYSRRSLSETVTEL